MISMFFLQSNKQPVYSSNKADTFPALHVEIALMGLNADLDSWEKNKQGVCKYIKT